MAELSRQIEDLLQRAGFQKRAATIFESSDHEVRVEQERVRQGVFYRLQRRHGEEFLTAQIHKDERFLPLAEELATEELRVLMSSSRKEAGALTEIELLLEDFSVPLIGAPSYRLLAKAWYDAGFVTPEAVKGWLVDADVFVPKVAQQFQKAGIASRSVARADLGTSDVVTLGHEVCIEQITFLEAVQLLRGELSNRELELRVKQRRQEAQDEG